MAMRNNTLVHFFFMELGQKTCKKKNAFEHFIYEKALSKCNNIFFFLYLPAIYNFKDFRMDYIVPWYSYLVMISIRIQ